MEKSMIPVYHPAAQVSPVVEDALCKAWTAMARAEGHRSFVPASVTRAAATLDVRYKRAEAVLGILKRGHSTVSEIATELDLSKEAVRTSLSGLQTDGKVRNVNGAKVNIVWGLAR